MDRPSTSTNPLFIEQDDDMSSYVTKSHLFGAQRALHQEQQAMTDRIDNLATDLRLFEQRTKHYFDNKLDVHKQENDARMDEIRALLGNRPPSTSSYSRRSHSSQHSETPSPAQVHRHRTLFDEPRVKTVMHLATRYKTSIQKSKPMSKSLVLTQTKSLLLKLKNDNDHDAKRNKTPRLNAFDTNYMKRTLLRRNVPFKNQVEQCPTAKRRNQEEPLREEIQERNYQLRVQCQVPQAPSQARQAPPQPQVQQEQVDHGLPPRQEQNEDVSGPRLIATPI